MASSNSTGLFDISHMKPKKQYIYTDHLGNNSPREVDHFKLRVVIDFGTDCIGLAYVYNGQIYHHNKQFSSGILIKKNKNDIGCKAIQFGIPATNTYIHSTD
eukprot:415549_1